jgi:hypothetical protein
MEWHHLHSIAPPLSESNNYLCMFPEAIITDAFQALDGSVLPPGYDE